MFLSRVARVVPRRQVQSARAVSTFFGTGDETLGKLLTNATSSKSSITTFTEIKLPDEIEGNIDKIRAGFDSTAFILDDGSLYVAGENKNGQLGLSPDEKSGDASTLKKVTDCELSDVGCADVRIHDKFGAAIDRNGNVHTWGMGYSQTMMSGGWLGHGEMVNGVDRPLKVESLVEDQCTASQISIGLGHMNVLTTEGEFLNCGCGSHGRLGNGEASTMQSYLDTVDMLEAMNLDIAKISSGNEFSMAMTEDGELWGWGRNEKSQLGVGGGMSIDQFAMESMPMRVEGQIEGKKIVDVSAGYEHTAAVTEDGELFFWGRKVFLEPQLMGQDLNVAFSGVSCGRGYTLAWDSDGHLYGWGDQKNMVRQSKHGVLGLGHTDNVSNPVRIPTRGKIKEVTAGQNHVIIEVDEEI